MTISLSPETQRLLDERLKVGTYASPDEALREGLLLLEHQEREHEAAFGELKAKLERGAAQAERGELTDGEGYFEQLLARLDGKADRSGRAMSGFDLTPDAREDLDAIAGYVANDSGAVRAAKVVSDIRDACRKLGEMPGMGHFRDDLLDRRYKFWPVHSYVIAYRWEARPIQVTAVVHGARSLSSFFRQRGR